ncbi:hypothetical protein [Myxococcus virescens]|uniref:Uncharacterized protein n=1 Tax=Myxococcus virescens TaxID=83456 RepID=A0ABY0MLC4_9BACT|nr:hypothetical protein [Myxococcus virescens]SDD86751.1 hypothetical protein SAMN04488504_1035 [Myxococcus virescens]
MRTFLRWVIQSRLARRLLAAALAVIVEELGAADRFTRRAYGNSPYGDSAHEW